MFAITALMKCATGKYSVGISLKVKTGVKVLLALLAVCTIASCSHQNTVSVEDLRSRVTEALSLASESETFIVYTSQKRATRNYARTHLQYLIDAGSRAAKESHDSAADKSTEQGLAELQKQLDSLVASLSYARQELDSPDHLQTAKERITSIRKALEGAKRTL